MCPVAPAARTRIVRNSGRACADRDRILSILDSTFLCHVAFMLDGEARVLPTAYVRIDDAVCLHGHVRNEMMNALLDGQTAGICVTLVDGLVLARSGFHHSVNYRSVTLYGKAQQVAEADKVAILDRFVNHVTPGRAAHLRPHTTQELKATLVVKVPIHEAVAKIRSGPPKDAEKDYESDVWAGVINLQTAPVSLEACPRLHPTVAVPDHVSAFMESGPLFVEPRAATQDDD